MKKRTSFHPNGSRYVLDFGPCSARNGFAQIDTDQDAWYFGTWANVEKRRFVQYAEGDLTILDFETVEELVKHLEDFSTWEHFRGVDPMGSTAVEDAFRELGLGNMLH